MKTGDTMNARDNYFAQLETIIYESNYLYLLYQKYHQRRQWIECVMAFLSGGCLAAWLLYNKFAMVYATVIVLTQILNSILPFFEIVKREEALRQATTEFQAVKRQAEIGWRRIDQEDLSDCDIETQMELLVMSEANVMDKLMALGFKDDASICTAASSRTDKYITCYLSK